MRDSVTLGSVLEGEFRSTYEGSNKAAYLERPSAWMVSCSDGSALPEPEGGTPSGTGVSWGARSQKPKSTFVLRLLAGEEGFEPSIS